MIEAAFKKKLIPINDSLATVDKAINKLFT